MSTISQLREVNNVFPHNLGHYLFNYEEVEKRGTYIENESGLVLVQDKYFPSHSLHYSPEVLSSVENGGSEYKTAIELLMSQRKCLKSISLSQNEATFGFLGISLINR